MTYTYDMNSFNWRRFCLHYEAEVMNRYRKTPAIANDKITALRELYKEMRHSDIEPDAVIEMLMQMITEDRGAIAAFCDPDRLEDPENLIEGYEWCVNCLSNKETDQEIRHYCAAQVGNFDEVLQEEEIDI